MCILNHQAVPATELRRLFNEGRYWERARQGEFKQKIVRDGHPSPEDSGEPHCTRSQMIVYINATGKEVARVHQYKRRGGQIGGKGRPDPKRLQIGYTVYRLQI